MEEYSKDPNGNLTEVFTIDMGSDTDDNSVAFKDGSSSEVDEDKSSPAYSYDELKSMGLLQAYRSSTVPIEVGGLNLGLLNAESSGKPMPGGNKPNVKVAWCPDQPLPPEASVSRKRKTVGSSASAAGSHAYLSAVVRRRQQRRLRRNGAKCRTLDCLRLVLSVLYYLGVSPYRPKSARKLPKSLTQLLKVFHWIVVAIAIVESIFYLKHCWIEFRLAPKIESIAEIGNAMISVVTRIYTVKVFAAMAKRMDTLLGRTPSNNSAHLQRDKRAAPRPSVSALIGIVVTFSIGMAVTSVIFGFHSFESWSFERHQRRVALDTSRFMEIWTLSNWKNDTEKLYEQYMQKPITTKGVILAIVGDIACYIGELYENLSIDFWLALSYQVYLLQLDLMNLSKRKNGSLVCGSGVTRDIDAEWDLYLDCRLECDMIDEMFGPLLKLVHVRNILRLSDFLLDLMESDFSVQRLSWLISLVKICASYYICKLSADTNVVMHEKVVNLADSNGFVEVNGVKLTLYALRMEMEHHPIGLGRGNFFIEETLLIKMVCAAWSVFALFADHSQGQR